MTVRICLSVTLLVLVATSGAASTPLATDTLWSGKASAQGEANCPTADATRPGAMTPTALQAVGSVGPRVVIVVRHAETAAEGSSDPPLSAAGLQRAAALARIAAAHDVEVAFATPFRRTLGTAGTAAEWLGLQAEAVPIPSGGIPAHVADVVARVRAANGAGALVVGHSNTVPAIIQALTGLQVGPIAESEYSRLFVVVLPAEGPPTVEERSY